MLKLEERTAQHHQLRDQRRVHRCSVMLSGPAQLARLARLVCQSNEWMSGYCFAVEDVYSFRAGPGVVAV